MRVAAQKATIVRDGKVVRFGLAYSSSNAFYHVTAIWANGGNILSEDGRSVVLDRPEAARGLQLSADMVHKDKSTIVAPYSNSTALQEQKTNFINGNVVFHLQSSGNLGEFKRGAKFEVGVQEPSRFKEDVPAPVPMSGSDFVIPAKAPKEQQEAAWTFIKYMTAKAQNVSWAQFSGFLPIRKSVIESSEMASYYQQNPQYKIIVDSLQHARPTPMIPTYTEVDAEVQKAIEQSLINNVLAETSLRQAADKIRSIIR